MPPVMEPSSIPGTN
ncbi:UNVERIFIED_CONTAM: hypothetical protein GTU68_039954 [Idotea baltica]|nr:hypothetical protein [Idotea baltica]